MIDEDTDGDNDRDDRDGCGNATILKRQTGSRITLTVLSIQSFSGYLSLSGHKS